MMTQSNELPGSSADDPVAEHGECLAVYQAIDATIPMPAAPDPAEHITGYAREAILRLNAWAEWHYRRGGARSVSQEALDALSDVLALATSIDFALLKNDRADARSFAEHLGVAIDDALTAADAEHKTPEFYPFHQAVEIEEGQMRRCWHRLMTILECLDQVAAGSMDGQAARAEAAEALFDIAYPPPECSR